MGMYEKPREEGCTSFFYFSILIESQTLVPIYLLGWKRKRSLLLAPAFISEALGIVKSNSRDK